MLREPLRRACELSWVTADPDDPGARWRFELAPVAGATRLRFSVVLGPGPSGITRAIESRPDKEPAILRRRVDEQSANMQRVVADLGGRCREHNRLGGRVHDRPTPMSTPSRERHDPMTNHGHDRPVSSPATISA